MLKTVAFSYFFTIFCVFMFSDAIASNLIDPERYIENIADRMVFHLKHNLVDTMFPIKDSKCNINDARFGKRVDGIVTFHSGFVVSIDSATLDEKTHEAKVDDEQSLVKSKFSLRGINIAYDVHYDLKPDNKGDAVFLIRYESFQCEISVARKHNGGALPEGKIEFSGLHAGGEYDLIVKIDPETPEAQLIARNLRYKPNFRGQTERFFNTWTKPLQEALEKAVKDIDYPKIDYFH